MNYQRLLLLLLLINAVAWHSLRISLDLKQLALTPSYSTIAALLKSLVELLDLSLIGVLEKI